VGVPVPQLPCHGTFGNGRQPTIGALVHQNDRWRWTLGDAFQDLVPMLSEVRWSPRQHFVKHGAQGVYVAASVFGIAAGQPGGQVMNGAFRYVRPHIDQFIVPERLGEAEIA